ncbi:MAG: hypothetical protein RIC56_04560 [Pseudomonadales bacterium]
MEATSYRASVVHYSQGDRILAFKDGSLLERLARNRVDDLRFFVADRLGMPAEEMDLDVIESTMQSYPEESQRLDTYLNRVRLAETLEDGEIKEEMLKAASDILEIWEEKGYLTPGVQLTPAIDQWIDRRHFLPSKYDSFRLLVEHQALVNETINAGPGPSGKRPFVPFENPDSDIEHTEFEGGIESYYNRLGISRMGLIRKFDLCYFTFGYSRMSASPALPNRHGMTMPVRLNLFSQVNVGDVQASPVYALTQGNEAIYVQLDERIVHEWLIRIQCEESSALSTDSVATTLLSNVFEFSQYLDNLPIRTEQRRPMVHLAVYSLLHTYAHHLIQTVTEFAGLDAGSLGEYIFPADLAFVVFRSGMTMDLGNISAMWRNNGRAFLDHLLSPISLDCGLGTLCTERGGACPDCLMIPEISCIAQNRLLSRSVLNGNGKPEEDGYNDWIEGYLSVAADRIAPGER